MEEMRYQTISPVDWRASLSRAIGRAKLVLLSTPNEPRAMRIGLIDFFLVVLALLFPWSTTATSGSLSREY